jgi:hypothetical protein
MSFDSAKARVDAVLGEALYWFPVRHHSPAVARHVRAAVRKRRPKVVFLEGPPDAAALLPHLLSAKTKPPVALYTSFRDDNNVLGLAGVLTPSADVPARLASWYPLLPYSPEYIAIKTADEVAAEVVFMDLPHYARPIKVSEASPQDGVPDAAKEVEHLIEGSSFYQALAAAAGYRTFDETWDSLFELTGHDTETFRRDLAMFCACSRETSPFELDGTAERERFMWRTITAELEKRAIAAEDAMVVCGGWHLFMPRDGADPPPIPAGTVYATISPFSYFRTSQLSGYGAGIRAPRYYQRLWDHLDDGTPDDAMVEQVVSSLHEARSEGEPVSSADAVSIAHIARGLASLRGRRYAALDDISDATITCCAKGDPADAKALLAAIHEAAVGTAVGKVTSELGQLPLVHDFYAQLHDLDLGAVVGRERRLAVDLDRRDAQDARRSAFYHRLVQIGIELAELIPAPAASGTVFKERWRTVWTPKLEQALIERNLYGDTVEAAATAKLEEEIALDPTVAGAVTGRWRRAVDMDLAALAIRLQQACGHAIDEDRRVASLAKAFADLRVLGQQATFRGLHRGVIDELSSRAFGRACFAIPDAADVPDEEKSELIESLSTLGEAVLADAGLDRVLFTSNVRTAATVSASPFLRGVFLGILAELREVTADELAGYVSAYARSLPEVRAHAGAFLEGVFAVSRTSILLGADSLVAAIDELLRSADWDAFVAMLPRLRHAFERLHERQRASIADRVAARYGLSDGDALISLGTSVGVAVALAEIDAKVAEILAEWDV